MCNIMLVSQDDSASIMTYMTVFSRVPFVTFVKRGFVMVESVSQLMPVNAHYGMLSVLNVIMGLW